MRYICVLQVKSEDEGGSWVDVESLASLDSVGDAVELELPPLRDQDDDSATSDSESVDAADLFFTQNRVTLQPRPELTYLPNTADAPQAEIGKMLIVVLRVLECRRDRDGGVWLRECVSLLCPRLLEFYVRFIPPFCI